MQCRQLMDWFSFVKWIMPFKKKETKEKRLKNYFVQNKRLMQILILIVMLWKDL